MITEKTVTIIESVHSWKEKNAAEFDYDIDRIIASAQNRERNSKAELLDPPRNQTIHKTTKDNQ